MITVYRRRVDLYSGTYRAAAWVDYSFDELFAGEPSSGGPGGCRRVEAELPAVEIQPPPLSRLVERDVDRVVGNRRSRGPALRLAVPGQTDWGYDAEIAYRLAALGERGFTMARRRDDGPSLFGDQPEVTAHPEASAYPRAATRPEPPPPPPPTRLERDRGELVAIARKVVDAHHAALVDRIAGLEDAIRRALEQHRAALEHDEPGRYATARAILESALDWSPAATASAQAKSA